VRSPCDVLVNGRQHDSLHRPAFRGGLPCRAELRASPREYQRRSSASRSQPPISAATS
jgi:hypothetical protein